MTKTNEPLSNLEPQENYSFSENNLTFKSKNKSSQQNQVKPDLTKSCLLCDIQIQVKYIPPKKRYSLKNNWGYWTQKEEDKQKYLCNSCLLKLYDGNINDWIPNETKADVFYNYVKRGQF